MEVSDDAGKGDFREEVATESINLFREVWLCKEETVARKWRQRGAKGGGGGVFKDQGCWMGSACFCSQSPPSWNVFPGVSAQGLPQGFANRDGIVSWVLAHLCSVLMALDFL